MAKHAITAKFVLLLIVATIIAAFFIFDASQYLSFDYLKSQQAAFETFYAQNVATTLVVYFLIYIVVTSLSLPGATVMTLAGGAIFGLSTGTLLVSFASTIGATLAFLVSRFLLRDFVQNRYRDRLRAINEGIENEGAFYLFTLRLIPLFPFFVINLAMGITPIKTWKYYIVSQIGMFPATVVYVNAGSQLASINTPTEILSFELLLSFALLGLFPLIAKKLVDFIKSRKALKPYKKPKRFEYNMVVIGGGSAGLVSAYIAATVKAKVALIEKNKMGGDCLNTGCVPSKAFIRSAKILSYATRAKEFGFRATEVDFDFADVMQRVQNVIKKVEPHDSTERYTGLGVDVIQSEAKIVSPYEVQVSDGRILTTKNIVIATGAKPFVPNLPGLENVDYLTSDTLWELREQPKNLVVLGGGPIGSELAQSFQRLGTQVTMIQRGYSVLPKEDEEICLAVKERLQQEGMQVLVEHEALRVEVEGNIQKLICRHNDEEVEVPIDKLLIALGRRANVGGFGLEELKINVRNNGTLEADDFLRTNFPNIFVCGDVTGPYQFTHVASHQAWYASVNALFQPFKKFRVDYRVIPWATFTDPEVARVGLNEKEAKQKNIPYEITSYGIDDLDRAIADGESHGVVKVLTAPGKDKILGVTIMGNHASDLIAEFVTAMKYNLGLNKILGTIHIYPTMAEANKYVAGKWKKAHAPKKLLHWVERFHAWRRG